MVVRIVGLGSVGMSVSDRLKEHSDFKAIVDGDRRERYLRDGLFYNGKKIDIPLITPETDDEKADLIIIATKNFDLDAALEEAKPFVKDDTVFLSLLNGIEAEDRIMTVFGEDKVLCSFIRSLSANHDGNSTYCFSPGTIVFGEKDNSLSDRVLKIKELFDISGQPYVIPSDILHEKWWKFMLNTAFNTLSAILDANYYQICDNEELFRASRMVMREVVEVAKSEGVILTQRDIESVIETMRGLKDQGKTSMLQDVIANRDTENRYFAGSISRLGKKHSIPTPYSDFIYLLLEAKRNVIKRG